jgi:putative Holliday junction resolvase
MRYLAIDYGAKSTGLAICDPSETIVSPLAVFSNGKDLVAKIVEIVKNETVSALVFGLPLNMDGTVGEQAKIVRAFADKLKKTVAVPIYFQDERLSTFAAQEKLPAGWMRSLRLKSCRHSSIRSARRRTNSSVPIHRDLTQSFPF